MTVAKKFWSVCIAMAGLAVLQPPAGSHEYVHSGKAGHDPDSVKIVSQSPRGYSGIMVWEQAGRPCWVDLVARGQDTQTIVERCRGAERPDPGVAHPRIPFLGLDWAITSLAACISDQDQIKGLRIVGRSTARGGLGAERKISEGAWATCTWQPPIRCDTGHLVTGFVFLFDHRPDDQPDPLMGLRIICSDA